MDLLCVVMNSNNYAEKLGKKNIINFVLIDLKRDRRSYSIYNESKDTYIECTPETNQF